MVKFLVALAELFSSFSAKLHDLSETVTEPQSIDSDDVREIIDDVLSTSVTNADDVKGLRRFVTNIVEDQQIDTGDIDGLEEFVMGCIPDPEEAITRVFRMRQLRDIVLEYATMYGHHRNISLTRETALLNQYMLDRITAWTNVHTHGEQDKTVLVIDTENNSSIKI
jgi:hypothetical protein